MTIDNLSNVLVGDRSTATSAASYLGPALVSDVRDGQITMELPHGAKVPITLALAYLYQPVPGDVLLVIGNGDSYYGIGVLHATGKAVLSFQGDVDVRAVDGTLRLSGDKGVQLSGPELELHSNKLRMVAGAVVQKFNSVFQRVSGLLHVHAEKAHTSVDGAAFTQSESNTILTKDIMTINGKQIHLG